MNEKTHELKEIEQLQVQLAGCGVLAHCNTRESLKQQMPERYAYGWSQSLQDVYDGAVREINERERADALEAAILSLAPVLSKEKLLDLAGQFHDGPVRIPKLVEKLTEEAYSL